METARSLQVIELGAKTIADVTRLAPDAIVSSCSPWHVVDLAQHVGSLHGWVAMILESALPPDGPRPPRDDPPRGLSNDEIVNWCESQTEALIKAIGKTDLDRPCWTFRDPHTGRFWTRRMALETIVHAFDADAAIGGRMELPPDIAIDGMDEFLDEILPVRVSRHPEIWSGETIHLHQTDGDNERLVTLGPEGRFVVTHEHAKGDIALRGSASDLYLWSINRRVAGQLESFGDLAVADKWEAEVFF